MSKRITNQTVPISGERLARALELRGLSIYALAQAIAKRGQRSAMKEAIRVIVSGRVTRTGAWRLELIAKALRVPAKWLGGEGPLVPSLRLTPDEPETIRPKDLATWDLFASWCDAFTRLRVRDAADDNDETEFLVSIREWWFVPGILQQLLDPAAWQAKLLVKEPGVAIDQEPEDLESAARHLTEAFRLILRPWTRTPSTKIDLLALNHFATLSRDEARATAKTKHK